MVATRREGGAKPVAVRKIRVGEHAVAYRRTGAGEPVLLLHGIVTHSGLWQDVVPLLARVHDVVALDLLGCGQSDKPIEVSYGLKAHADRLPAILAALGVERPHVVGHDLGGGIAQLLAVRHPEVVRDLVLVNSVAHDFFPVQPIIAMRTPVVRQMLMAAIDVGALRLLLLHGLHHREKLTAELVQRFRDPLRSPEGRRGFLHFARSIDHDDLTAIAADLAHLPMPVRLVWGTADPFLGPEIPAWLEAHLPQARLIRVPTASHLLPLDEPELLARVLVDFYREHAAPAAG
jgi:pimeloyl-ACP methyl ester carboxylesterase